MDTAEKAIVFKTAAEILAAAIKMESGNLGIESFKDDPYVEKLCERFDSIARGLAASLKSLDG